MSQCGLVCSQRLSHAFHERQAWNSIFPFSTLSLAFRAVDGDSVCPTYTWIRNFGNNFLPLFCYDAPLCLSLVLFFSLFLPVKFLFASFHHCMCCQSAQVESLSKVDVVPNPQEWQKKLPKRKNFSLPVGLKLA